MASVSYFNNLESFHYYKMAFLMTFYIWSNLRNAQKCPRLIHAVQLICEVQTPKAVQSVQTAYANYSR